MISFKNKFLSLTKTVPIGAPKVFDKQSDTLSKYEQYSFNEIPVSALAFQILAPSKCNLTLFC